MCLILWKGKNLNCMKQAHHPSTKLEHKLCETRKFLKHPFLALKLPNKLVCHLEMASFYFLDNHLLLFLSLNGYWFRSIWLQIQRTMNRRKILFNFWFSAGERSFWLALGWSHDFNWLSPIEKCSGIECISSPASNILGIERKRSIKKNKQRS